MLKFKRITRLLCIACFFNPFPVQANKLEELKSIEVKLKADLATEYKKWIAPLYWKPKEVASLNLTRISSWLSTLSDREFTLDEHDVLQQIFSQLLVLEQDDLPFPKAKLNDLKHFTLARDLENELNHLLRSAFLPSQSFATIEESGIWQSILHLLPEDEVAPKAQIDRRWRQEVYRYHKKKGYPPVLSQQDRLNLAQKLGSSEPRLSEDQIQSMVNEYEFTGYWGYYSFAKIVLRFLQTHALKSRLSPERSFYEELKSLHSHLPKRCMLSELIWELMYDVCPYIYSNIRDKRDPLTKPRILRQYFELASQGHFYAIQTLSWLKELHLIFPNIVYGAAFDVQKIDSLLSKGRPIFDFFPDVQHYTRWDEVRKRSVFSSIHPFTHQASLIRRYKGRDNQSGYLEVREYHNLGSIEQAPSFFLDRKHQAPFFSRMKKNSKDRYSDDRYAFDFYSKKEADCYVALGDPQRAILLVNGKEKPNSMGQFTARLYEAMLILKSGLSESDLIHGRNESEQIRLAHDFHQNKSAKSSIPKQLLDTELHMEAFEYDSFLKQTEDLYVPLSKQDLIKSFYKGGVLKSIERKIKRDDDLSELDSITDPTIYWAEASELLLNQTESQINHELFSPEEVVLLRLLAETKDDPRIWDTAQYPTEEDIGVRSSLKLFKSVIQTHREIKWIIPGGVLTTQIAQALLENGDASRCLDFLAKAERGGIILNFVDHALKVRALQALGQDSSVAIVQQTNHERTILLPDLRQAATFYEEDQDLPRAKKALARACQLSEKLADPGLEEDRLNHQRVVSAMNNNGA